MKVTPAHYAIIRCAVTANDTPERRARYLAGDYPNAPAQDLDVRYRFDLLWLAKGEGIECIYEYKDAHLETALKRIVPPLSREATAEQIAADTVTRVNASTSASAALERYATTPSNETCPTCGQPDNCGDCDHTTIDPDDLDENAEFQRVID